MSLNEILNFGCKVYITGISDQGDLKYLKLNRLEHWPEEAIESMQHLNKEVLNEIQGPNEFIFNGNAKNCDRWNNLKDISIPTLVISGNMTRWIQIK